MDNLKDKSLKDLADRLNEIMKIRTDLDLEYNLIVYELWDRVPSLKGDPNLELRDEKSYRRTK